MQDFISVKVLSLRDLFSDAYQFRLPWFQRSYAWLPGEVGRLLADLLEAMRLEGAARRYFLGNIMVAKEPNAPQSALVDGHQRVMTLTILFSVLRDFASSEAAKRRLHVFVADAAGAYRLIPQDALRDYVEHYVQAPGATMVDVEENLSELSETERNILDNREYLKSELGDRGLSPDTLTELAAFLADHCFLTVAAVRDEHEAWRFLQIEESTRHRFNATNRAKASLLAIVKAAERERCRAIWDRCELMLGSEDMFAILGHLRTLKTRKLSDKPADAELAEAAAIDRNGLGFMAQEMEPAAVRLAALRRAEIGSSTTRKEVADSIDRMSWISSQAWVPAALHWLEMRGDGGETPKFFKLLERLMWVLRLAGVDPSRQQRHIIRLLAEIDKNLPVGAMRELEIGRALREDALTSLRINTFDQRRYASRVLRRISIAMGQDPGPVHVANVTIEHVLPCGWIDDNDWRRNFRTPKLVKAHAHRLGNLTFLSGEHNQKADSNEWKEKKAIYARSEFLMTRELTAAAEWTPRAIEERSERLIGILLRDWELTP